MIPCAYIHVPFCAHLCTYCAFGKTLNLQQRDLWLKRLLQEFEPVLKQAAAEDASFALQTIYIGGGTPSALSDQQMKTLLSALVPYAAKECEWTVEMNPETMTLKLLSLCHQYGINRLSIGLQTFDDDRLQALGRKHTAAMAKKAVVQARKAGFDNLSGDLMFGFAKQSMQDLENDLAQLLSLDLPHVSIYSLILEEQSVWGVQGYEAADEELCALMYERIVSVMEENGYIHYEISSFCKPGYTSRHNLRIWQDGYYYGFGWGAVGRDERGISSIPGALEAWLQSRSEREWQEDETPWLSALMMGLRTKQGVSITDWNGRYGLDLLTRYRPVWEKYADRLVIDTEHIAPNNAGMEILDSILLDLFVIG